MQDTTPQLTKQRNHIVSGTLIASAMVFAVAAGAGTLWGNRTMDVPLTAESAYSCPNGQEATVPINTGDEARRKADIVSTNTYGEGGVKAITTIRVSLRPSSDLAKEGYAITAGQLLVEGHPVASFTVDDPGTQRSVRFNPAALNPPPNAELKLCLLPQ